MKGLYTRLSKQMCFKYAGNKQQTDAVQCLTKAYSFLLILLIKHNIVLYLFILATDPRNLGLLI